MSWSDPAIADRGAFTYDAAGRMTEADNDYSEVTRTYDPAGRLKTDTQNIAGFGSRKVQYKYSQDALLLRMWVADGNGYDRTYAYDDRARLEFIQNTGDGVNWFQYFYDQASNEVKRYNFWNGVSQEYGRDEINRMSWRNVKLGAATIPSEVYRYDEMSRLRMVDREDGKRDRFIPDLYSGQLDIAKYDLVNDANPTKTVDYNWDKAGNRVSVADTGSTTNYARNLVNQYTSVGNNTVTMGGNHEIAVYSGNTYKYIGDGQASNIDSNANHYAVVYDALGRPVKRTLTGTGSIDQTPTYYVYDGDKPILEYKANGNLAGLNVYGKGIDEILMRSDYVVVPAGQRYFYQQNHQGSVTHLTDSTGAVIEKYSYDAFGKTTTTTMTGASYNNRFKFTGRELLPVFSVYEYRARIYHPGLGRFMSEDPKGFDAGDYNLFRYCGNDPVDRTDPMGLDFYQRGGSEGDWSKFNTAIAYMSENREAAAMVRQLRAFNVPVYFNHAFKNGSTVDNGIVFDPTHGQIIPGKGLQSAALILAHEFKHLHDQIKNPEQFAAYRRAGNLRLGGKSPDPANRNEESALKMEKSVATTKREPWRTTAEYRNGTTPQKVESVTTHTIFEAPIGSNIKLPIVVPDPRGN